MIVQTLASKSGRQGTRAGLLNHKETAVWATSHQSKGQGLTFLKCWQHTHSVNSNKEGDQVSGRTTLDDLPPHLPVSVRLTSPSRNINGVEWRHGGYPTPYLSDWHANKHRGYLAIPGIMGGKARNWAVMGGRPDVGPASCDAGLTSGRLPVFTGSIPYRETMQDAPGEDKWGLLWDNPPTLNLYIFWGEGRNCPPPPCGDDVVVMTKTLIILSERRNLNVYEGCSIDGTRG